MFIKFKTTIYLAIITSVLSGCATVTPEQKAKWEETAPFCYSKSDCGVKWASARQWVQENSGYKIQIYSDDFIETYNPKKNDPQIAVSVSKNPIAKLSGEDQINVIWIRVFCGNIFSCNPPVNQAVLSFNAFVSQADVNDPACYKDKLNNIDTPKLGFYSVTYQNSKRIVKRVCSNSPASKAGLKVNDIIRKVDNKNTHNTKDFMDAMKKIKFGQEIPFDILRSNISHTLRFKVPYKDELASHFLANEAQTPRNSLSIEQKLEALSRLLNKGIINKEEFNIKKKELLNDL